MCSNSYINYFGLNLQEFALKQTFLFILRAAEKNSYSYWRNEEGDPGHHDEHGGGEVD